MIVSPKTSTNNCSFNGVCFMMSVAKRHIKTNKCVPSETSLVDDVGDDDDVDNGDHDVVHDQAKHRSWQTNGCIA